MGNTGLSRSTLTWMPRPTFFLARLLILGIIKLEKRKAICIQEFSNPFNQVMLLLQRPGKKYWKRRCKGIYRAFMQGTWCYPCFTDEETSSEKLPAPMSVHISIERRGHLPSSFRISQEYIQLGELHGRNLVSKSLEHAVVSLLTSQTEKNIK